MNKQELIKHFEEMEYVSIHQMGKKAFIDMIEQLDEPQPIKLKDVIARIKIFDVGTQKVWLNEILNELGSDYGVLKYKAGYERGKLEGEWLGQQLKDADKIRQELNKPVVPQFVANWYEQHKYNFEFNVWDYVYRFEDQEKTSFKKWFNNSKTKTFQTLVKMHLFGYEIEKEKRYLVKMKGISSNMCYLNRVGNKWIIAGIDEHTGMNIYTKHTKKELEEDGFGDVFNSPLFEVEEVEE